MGQSSWQNMVEQADELKAGQVLSYSCPIFLLSEVVDFLSKRPILLLGWIGTFLVQFGTYLQRLVKWSFDIKPYKSDLYLFWKVQTLLLGKSDK